MLKKFNHLIPINLFHKNYLIIMALFLFHNTSQPQPFWILPFLFYVKQAVDSYLNINY